MKTVGAVLVAVVILVGLGGLLTLRAESGGASGEGGPVYGPIEVKEMIVQWADRDEETIYAEHSRLTVYADWVRLDELVQRSLRKYDTMIVPRSRVKQIVLVKP